MRTDLACWDISEKLPEYVKRDLCNLLSKNTELALIKKSHEMIRSSTDCYIRQETIRLSVPHILGAK